MAVIHGDLKPLGALASHYSLKALPPSMKQFGGFHNGGSSNQKYAPKWLSLEQHGHARGYNLKIGVSRNALSPSTVNQEAEGFLHNVVNMNFFDRLSLAWKILFPTPAVKRNSNAQIAKQRLKMILFSDRCAVSDEAKKKIVKNIVQALSEFVEIDSQDKVQLSVSTDADLGTVYSVTVPVRRVKPEYQESEENYIGKITGIEYKDTGETSGTVDVTFDFFVPNEK
ncbi:cell division topological specificity factor homolog, chloroplastic [Ananas comosus]|uniref:Cell division topological specificity factor homolog, chloroplastic n=1 Tax=Ananas comosus TaxID=4615 RepID=A0A199US24_ANACO|nr:cell division topological specificity factor homolog, chloroplastic [Ananas comosus]OAY67607.1 Cell division topological specificity factor, chloroplastic [Ananas comosus]